MSANAPSIFSRTQLAERSWPYPQRRSTSQRIADAAKSLSVPRQLGSAPVRTLISYRLRIVCERLDDLLAAPVQVADNGSVRTVVAMSCVGYRIDRNERTVTPGRIHLDGGFEAVDFRVEIFRPLCSGWWLRWLIDDVEAVDNALAEQTISWLSQAVYRLLRKSGTFRRIRRCVIPRALSLDPKLLRIALMARCNTRYLMADEYAWVWQNAAVFEQTERENPKLLPLVKCFLKVREPPDNVDVIAALKADFRDEGLSEAAWRYVARHGARIFKVPWQMSYNGSAFHVVISYLQALDRAGLPPPPPPALTRAWLRLYIAHDCDRIRFRYGWSDVPGHVLRSAFRRAEEMRRSPALPELLDSFLSVANWVYRARPTLDSNQRKAGWQWLVRHAGEWELEHGRNLPHDQTWQSCVGEFSRGNLIIKPLVSRQILVRQAHLMRNCLSDYSDDCAAGLVRLFAVYQQGTTRPVAHVAITYDSDSTHWSLSECKGFANSPANRHIETLGEEIAHIYDANCNG